MCWVTARSFPQAFVLDLGHIDFESVLTRRTAHDAHRIAVGVDPFIQALEMVEVGCEQSLDHLRRHTRDRSEPGDRSRQQQHGQIGPVRPNVSVPKRLDLVASRGQSNDAFTVVFALLVDVTDRQRKCDFCLNASTPSLLRRL
jgi:hypothetical protein